MQYQDGFLNADGIYIEDRLMHKKSLSDPNIHLDLALCDQFVSRDALWKSHLILLHRLDRLSILSRLRRQDNSRSIGRYK